MMDVLAKKTARQYELTCLVPVDYTETELEQLKKKITGLITKAKGEVTKNETWEKKPLAYTIVKSGKRHQEANYFYFEFTAPSDQIASLNRTMNLDEQVLRHLLVVKED